MGAEIGRCACFDASPPSILVSPLATPLAAGDLIGRELQPVYATATAGGAKPSAAAPLVQLPPRLLQLLAVAGQHLYHNVAGALQWSCRSGNRDAGAGCRR